MLFQSISSSVHIAAQKKHGNSLVNFHYMLSLSIIKLHLLKHHLCDYLLNNKVVNDTASFAMKKHYQSMLLFYYLLKCTKRGSSSNLVVYLCTMTTAPSKCRGK